MRVGPPADRDQDRKAPIQLVRSSPIRMRSLVQVQLGRRSISFDHQIDPCSENRNNSVAVFRLNTFGSRLIAP